MLVDSPGGVSSSECSPRHVRSTDKPRLRELGPASAESHRRGEDTGFRGNEITKDPERNRPGAPFLGVRGQPESIGDFAGGDHIDQAPLQPQQPRPGDAATGKGSPLWGQGGLLSPWRVRLLLLLTFVVTVRKQGCWWRSHLALACLFCCQSLDYVETRK